MLENLTQSKTHDDPAWDSRDCSLTLAGCLHLAGMPLASEQVVQSVTETVTKSLPDEQAEADAPDACCREEWTMTSNGARGGSRSISNRKTPNYTFWVRWAKNLIHLFL